MEQKKREILAAVEQMNADKVWILWRFICNLMR